MGATIYDSTISSLTQFWKASGTFWSNCWASIYQLSGEDDFILYTIVTTVAVVMALFCCNLIYGFIDLTGWPKWIHKYKIQDQKEPITVARYWKILKRVIFNSAVVGPFHQLVTWPLVKWRGVQFGYTLPSFSTALLHLAFSLLFLEVTFYYLHRLFHHPKLYKHIHKIHHEITEPFSITATYCHPVEHFVVNLLPVTLGPIVIGAHISVTWIWLIITIITITNNHCGYHLPFFPSPEAHDYHHFRFNQNFGASGIFDCLHNTDEGFRRSKAYERHILLLGLSPAKKLFPDTPKD